MREINSDELFVILYKYVKKYEKGTVDYKGVYYINNVGSGYIPSLVEWIHINLPELKKGYAVRVFRPQLRVYKPNTIGGAIYISPKISDDRIYCKLKHEDELLDEFILIS
jgi:hypothetical protein